MPKSIKNSYVPSLVSMAVFCALISQYASANLQAQCLLGVPHFQGEIIAEDDFTQPIYIEADDALINQPNDATYTGNVIVKQGHRYLNAEQIRVEQQNKKANRAYLTGAFDYRDERINATGENADLDLASNNANFANVHYQLVGQQGRGNAAHVELNEKTRVLKNATYTACLPNDRSWAIDAKEMIQYIDDEYAEMWHARFKVWDIPVFYTPYLQFPIGDRRRSGFLIPQNVNHSSRDGYSYGQPIYWNIAPNMDATFTPTYMSRRGWQWKPEFRYLTRSLGEGVIAAEYLNKDRLHEWTEKDRSRHMLFWRHLASLNDWRLSVDYTRVSDKRYFSDFDSDYGHSTDGYATQNFKLGYYQPNYNLAISGKKFQTFDELNIGPYRVLPQIDFNYYKNNIVDNGDFHLYAQTAHFSNDSKLMPTAWRFHLEPTLNFPFVNRYGTLNVETKLYATHYLQQKGKGENAEDIERHVTRVLPQVKVDFRTILESDKKWVDGFTQTFSPRVQYLFRPYQNQSNIGSKRHTNLGLGYDSALLQQDYFSLFHDRRYSGLDRIASANQIAFGGSTHFFSDKTGEEIFNLSAGQIYYFTHSKIDGESLNSNAKRSSSWSIEGNWKFHPKWNFHGSYQYDTRLNETSLANASLQFKPKEEQIIQLNYRFASHHYIDQNLQRGGNRYGQDIKQLGGVVGWNFNDSIAVMASHYRDLALKKPVESQIAFNYNTCCWTITFYAARRLTNTPSHAHSDTVNDLFYDNRFGVNFELRGFDGYYRSGVSKMLKRGIIPYTEAFNIN